MQKLICLLVLGLLAGCGVDGLPRHPEAEPDAPFPAAPQTGTLIAL